jgi:hypothetical protein
MLLRESLMPFTDAWKALQGKMEVMTRRELF